MSSLVAKSNTIYVPAEFLGTEKGKKLSASWSQRMKTRNEDYWMCKYTVKSGGSGEGVIFVQASKLEEFKSKKTTGDDFTVLVDDSFQYGQNKEMTKRFLVYHDKDNKPYQHRFMANMFTEVGSPAAEFVKSLGYGDVSKVEDIVKHFAGDYLKDF